MANRKKIDSILRKCEEVFGRDSASQWKHGDYIDLGNEIFKETKVNISPNTLKRIFGKISVDEDYLPQQATLEALIAYCKYVPNSESVNAELNSKSEAVNPLIRNLIIGFSVLVGLIFAVYWFSSKSLDGKISISKQDGKLPLTVHFNIVQPHTSDSVFIDFGDKSEPQFIKPDQTSIGHNYVFPGVFDVKMIANKEAIDTAKVIVLSEKWIALAFNRQRDIPKTYYEYSAIKNKRDSTFHVLNNDLFKMGLDTVGSLYTRLCNYRNTNYKEDSFTFESTIKSHVVKNGVYCNGVQFQITGEKHIIRFKFVNDGCSYRVKNIISEKVYDGQLQNLSDFTLNLSKWNSVKIVNQDKKVKLFVNDRFIFEENYRETLGEIKGVFVEFEGNGYVKTCKLLTKEQKSLFEF